MFFSASQTELYSCKICSCTHALTLHSHTPQHIQHTKSTPTTTRRDRVLLEITGAIDSADDGDVISLGHHAGEASPEIILGTNAPVRLRRIEPGLQSPHVSHLKCITAEEDPDVTCVIIGKNP
jgi:hypothetical protein